MRAVLPVAAAALAALGVAAWQWPSLFHRGIQSAGLLVSGNIEAHESVVGFKSVQARIVELPFNEGQTVAAGTLLARVDDTDYRQQVRMAETALEVQRRQLATAEQNLVAAHKVVASDKADLAMRKLDYERYQELWKHGFSPTQQRDQYATLLAQSVAALERDEALESADARQIDQARAAIDNAREAVNMARITLGYTVLNAPFEGVILVRQAELGELAVPGAPVVTLADLDHIWVRAYINETDLARVRLGATAQVSTDSYKGRKYQGRVSFIASAAEFTPKSVETHAERVTLVYRIKIDVDNPTHELVPGMPADAVIALSP
jgi:HlyD family secretion protein